MIPHSSTSFKEKESICLLYEQKENLFVGRSCAYSLAELPFSQKQRRNSRNQILTNTCIALLYYVIFIMYEME